MRRFRVKGRFYFFLILIAVVIFLIVKPYLNTGADVEVIMPASSEYTQTMSAVIIRDETAFTSGSVARVEYVASEDTLISAGDTVCYTYSTGYSESELAKLEVARENIQAYHKTMLENIIDTDLERYDTIVDMQADEFRNLANHVSSGNLIAITRQLETAMVNRQEYMRSNMRNDLKLNNLYSQENTRLNSIASWRVEQKAESDGVVSFYCDGYEDRLNAESLETITAADISTVIAGKPLGASSSREKAVYRIVDQNLWYVAILASGEAWNPVVDQKYSIVFDGFADLAFTARVSSVSQSDGQIMAVFEIDDPIGPMIYQRSLSASISTTLIGLSVSVDAIYDQNGQTGVWLYDVEGGTFVPVTVLSTDGKMALIEPLEAGVLATGQMVLIK